MPLDANLQNSTALIPVPVPGTDNRLMAIQRDGEVWVSPNHICMALDIDWKSQHRKLTSKPWAVMVKSTMTAADGKNYQTTMIDRKTLGMWLATIDARRIKSDYARSILEAYQVEAADALDSYFHEGAAINPRAGMDAETLIEKFHLPRNYGEALRELADTTEKVEELTVENTALKGGDGIRIKDFIKTYFTAPNERAIFEWFYFHGYLIDGRLQDDDGRALRGSGGGPKLRWDHMHPTYIGRRYFKLVPSGKNPYGGQHTRIIPERALDLVAVLMNAKDLPTQMTMHGREALDKHRAPGQLRVINGSAVS
ncbi:phage antirepressor N-terminal domain-containing protein [Corynebacterium glutamicum]|uniref:phage antirepressor N-terminal domain-containing protein n=1 Tax=Corynebacterium glutamicum TaxID=1718 RepID=UPI001B8AB073|nr:phage antirepressor N-terminal domain-containing protein [Corynebacterium glutamicum]